MGAAPIANRVSALDVDLFEAISSQTTEEDRRSFLAVQRLVAARLPEYTYLEIGSHLGGTIQPHLLDGRCRHIVSIDTRPFALPDERGVPYFYPENSTERMLANLEALDPGARSKLTTFDCDASEIEPGAIAGSVDLMLIDGEHTNRAARSDFRFCRGVAATDAAIVFHDADLVYGAIAEACAGLDEEGARYRAFKLKDSVFCVLLGAFAEVEDNELGAQVENTDRFFRYAKRRLIERRLRSRLARSPIYRPYRWLRRMLGAKP